MRQSAAVFGLGLVLALGGCATMGGGGAAHVNGAMDVWRAALEAQDIDGMMSVYSENYSGQQGGKPSVKYFLQDAKAQGWLSSLDIDTSNAVTEVDGGTANYGPINIAAGGQYMTLEFELEKEDDGEWRIVGSDSY